MKIQDPKIFSDLEIMNIIITLHVDHHVFIQSWGEFIFGKEINLPPELKNRIFCIWFSGVLDLIVDKEDQFHVLHQECIERDLNNCKTLMDELTTLTDAISDNAKRLSHEEQILVNHHRNSLVHARVYSIHNKKVGFLKYLDHNDGRIKKYNGSKDEFWQMHRDIITGNMDQFLSPLREKFFDQNTSYYKILVTMTNSPFFDIITEIAYRDLKR